MNLRTTHTFAVLELSAAAWEEIAAKLCAAGYDHAFVDDGCIDMHGIGVKAEARPTDGQDRYDVRFARDVPLCDGLSGDGRTVYVANELPPLTEREQRLIDAHEQMEEDYLNGLTPGMPPRVRRGLR